MAVTTTIVPANIAIAMGVAAPVADSAMDKQWKMWIADAVMLIDDRATQLAVTGVDQAKVDYVVREAVVAHVKRPDDATQVTVAIDDGSSSKTYRSGKGRVTILDEWWTLLGLTPTSGAFSIDTAPAATFHLPWCSIAFGSLSCSCGASIAGQPIYEGDTW